MKHGKTIVICGGCCVSIALAILFNPIAGAVAFTVLGVFISITELEL